MKEILCLLPVTEQHKEKLEKAAEGCRISYVKTGEETREQVAAAEIIIGSPRPSLIQSSERLRLLQLNTAGADPYLCPGVLAENTVLTNATGAYSKAVAEHGLACLLMLQKKLHLYRDAQKRSQWTDFGTVSSLTDAVVLVMGLGDIGTHFARLVKALGAYVIGIRRRSGAAPEGVDECYARDELENVIGRADVIFSVMPGTSDTKHFYTKELFAQMKKSAIFINCGRGSAVESSVLQQALTRGEIAAAAVDVTEIEPLPGEHPLWKLENLLITPHISGWYHLPETLERIVDISCDNLRRYLNGEELRNVVDFSTGYRK